MKLFNIKVLPNSKKNEIVAEGDRLIVRVKAPAVGGKANKATINALAEYFKVKKNKIRIIKGQKTRKKVIEIDF